MKLFDYYGSKYGEFGEFLVVFSIILAVCGYIFGTVILLVTYGPIFLSLSVLPLVVLLLMFRFGK